MGMVHPVGPACAEGPAVDKEHGFTAGIQIQDDPLPAGFLRDGETAEHPGVIPGHAPGGSGRKGRARVLFSLLTFFMTDKPNKDFGKAKQNRPYQKIEEKIEILPYLEYKGTGTFTDKLSVTTKKIDENYKSKVLKTELINDTWKLEESFEKYDSKNNVHFSAQLLKIPAGRTIKLLTPYSSQYTGGGDNALIDLRQGGTNWKLGTFQGYWGENVEAVIDLGSEKEITKLGGNFAQDERAWIFMPTKVEYYVSSDGKSFTLLETVNNPIDERDETIQTHTFFTSKKAKTRYIKMKAYNRMTNPDWHLSPGEKSWLFIDEIIIR